MKSKSKDKVFYEEFIDSQLFQQFIQDLLKYEYNYFDKKIQEEKDKENEKKIKKKKKVKEKKEQENIKEAIFITKPDFLGAKKNDKESIENIVQATNEFEKNDDEVKQGILERVNFIDETLYDNSKCIIYLIPQNKRDMKKGEGEKQKLQATLLQKMKINKDEQNEKIKDKIKEDIKDTVTKIFKSKIGEDFRALRNETSRHLENPFGREFFVSLISNNNNNIISLQENSFNFLSDLIKCTLNTVLKLEETDKIIEEIVILIKSTQCFEKEVKSKKNVKIVEHYSIYQHLKKSIHEYSKISQNNLWQKWYELELKKQEDQDNNGVKEAIVMKVCSEIIDLELQKTTVKKIIDSINKTIYEEKSEPYINFQKNYLKVITSSHYISKC
jgi:hypothetical protein